MIGIIRVHTQQTIHVGPNLAVQSQSTTHARPAGVFQMVVKMESGQGPQEHHRICIPLSMIPDEDLISLACSAQTRTSGILLRAISILIVDMFLMSITVPFIGLPRLDVRMHGGRRVCTSTIRPL